MCRGTVLDSYSPASGLAEGVYSDSLDSVTHYCTTWLFVVKCLLTVRIHHGKLYNRRDFSLAVQHLSIEARNAHGFLLLTFYSFFLTKAKQSKT